MLLFVNICIIILKYSSRPFVYTVSVKLHQKYKILMWNYDHFIIIIFNGVFSVMYWEAFCVSFPSGFFFFFLMVICITCICFLCDILSYPFPPQLQRQCPSSPWVCSLHADLIALGESLPDKSEVKNIAFFCLFVLSQSIWYNLLWYVMQTYFRKALKSKTKHIFVCFHCLVSLQKCFRKQGCSRAWFWKA